MLGKIFKTFFTLGFFSFGGGYSMIPLIEREIVEKYKIMDKNKFADIVSIAGGLPGAIGLNIAIFIGKTTCGLKGAVVGAAASVIPCLIIISSIMVLFSNISDNPYVVKGLTGVSGVVVAFILYATYKIALTAFKNYWYGIITVITFFVSLFYSNIPLPLIIVISMFAGIGINWAVELYKKIRGDK
ncbi:chromate transporter [Fusobacterium sp. SB021]|uniref:chromate transporter n=1 Tax=Fusobacterium sp. SB021 TaxID=2744227 RepID=UPI003CE76F38